MTLTPQEDSEWFDADGRPRKFISGHNMRKR